MAVSNQTDIAKAIKASIGVEASRVLVAGVLVGGYVGCAFVDFWKIRIIAKKYPNKHDTQFGSYLLDPAA